MWPTAEITPAATATREPKNFPRICGKVVSPRNRGLAKMRGIRTTALSQAPTSPVKSIQAPDNPRRKPSPPRPMEKPPPTSVATTESPT